VARRGRKLGIGLIVLVIVLLVAAVIADRVAAGVAADQLAQQAKKELVAREITSPSDPKASIGGFPFLTQVLGGVYQKITIKVDQPQANNVKLRDITVVATTVHADARSVMNGTGTVTADRVVGTANLDWDAVRSLIQLSGVPNIDPKAVQLSVVNNRIEAKLPLNLPVGQVTLHASGALEVAAGKVRVQLANLTAEGGNLSPQLQTLVQRYIQQNSSKLVATINVPAMPYRLVINKVETSDAGVVVIASADNVKLAG
jgi:hypothetical protein